jgi:hypothetical protein
MWLEALAFFSTLFKQLFKRNVVQHWLSNQLFQAGGFSSSGALSRLAFTPSAAPFSFSIYKSWHLRFHGTWTLPLCSHSLNARAGFQRSGPR